MISMCTNPLAIMIGLELVTLSKSGYSEPSLRYFLDLAKNITLPLLHTSYMTTNEIISWEGDISLEQLVAIFATSEGERNVSLT